MLIIKNIISPLNYKFIKEKSSIYIEFIKEKQTELDIIFMKKAFSNKDIVFIENFEYLIESYIIEGYIVKFILVNYPIK